MRGFKMHLVFVLILYSCHFIANAESSILKDISQSAVDTTKGVLEKIPDVIPSPEDIFQSAKNLIAGYPLDIAASAINTFCSAALSTKKVSPRHNPDIANMSFVLMIGRENVSVPLQQPALLWKKTEFNTKYPLVVFVTGWTTNFNETNEALETMYKAYECRGDINFVAIDTAKYVDTLYTWSAFNTEELGKIISEALVELIKTYPIEKIHLIGHSLGAHIVGATGRYLYYKTQKLLPRITGLDPANPCFNEGEALSGLSRGDADFVDIIHSNPGVLGKRDSIGDADFYPNGLDPLPPGCLSITCAHGRAWEFMAESVYPGNENNFMGVKCGSLTALTSNFCPGQSFPMGFATPKNLKGNYFLKTNSESPYGENSRKEKAICKNVNKDDKPTDEPKNEITSISNNNGNTSQPMNNDARNTSSSSTDDRRNNKTNSPNDDSTDRATVEPNEANRNQTTASISEDPKNNPTSTTSGANKNKPMVAGLKKILGF